MSWRRSVSTNPCVSVDEATRLGWMSKQWSFPSALRRISRSASAGAAEPVRLKVDVLVRWRRPAWAKILQLERKPILPNRKSRPPWGRSPFWPQGPSSTTKLASRLANITGFPYIFLAMNLSPSASTFARPLCTDSVKVAFLQEEPPHSSAVPEFARWYDFHNTATLLYCRSDSWIEPSYAIGAPSGEFALPAFYPAGGWSRDQGLL